MFDIGWTELLLIGIVALIVVGPKDLPRMFRALGRFVGQARAMAREFQRAMEQAADESGVKDMAREFNDATSGKDFGADELRKFAKGPKAWAKEAAKKSVLKDDAPGDKADTAAEAPRPRGPATDALAAARAEAAEARRAEAAARREAGAASQPDPTAPEAPSSPVTSGPATPSTGTPGNSTDRA
jgi:sec-independent protein translocase protein TatB